MSIDRQRAALACLAAAGLVASGDRLGAAAVAGRIASLSVVGDVVSAERTQSPPWVARPGAEASTSPPEPSAAAARPAPGPPSSAGSPGSEPGASLAPAGGRLPAVGERSARPADVLADPSPPRSISIPAIGVEATVAPAGVAAGGELEVPPDGATVAWFSGGARPGDAGSALLAGHVDWAGRAAVFYDLVELPLGATVLVRGEDGAERRFVVTGRRSFPKGEVPAEVFRRNGPAVLTLVTCGGFFDEQNGSYRENVVVEAVLA